MNRLILTERARPHSLLVDATGRRFVNEAQNYNDLGRTLQNFHPGSYTFPHVPAWLIFDSAYRSSYRLGPLGRRDPDPEWLAKGDTLADLAGAGRAPGRRAEGDRDALQRGRAARRGPRLRPRLVPVRPLHRRHRAGRGGPVLRAARRPGLPEHQGRPAHRRRRPRALDRRRRRRSRASTRSATARRARSAWPTPAPAARSARASRSASGRATRPPRTDERPRARRPRGGSAGRTRRRSSGRTSA